MNKGLRFTIFFSICIMLSSFIASAQKAKDKAPSDIAEITGFTGMGEKNDDKISWITLAENNTGYFSVERSRDSAKWEVAFRLKAEGNSDNNIPYSWNDDSPYPGITFYRIKIVYADSSFEYTKSIAVDSKVQIAVEMYPVFTGDIIQLTVMGKENETSNIKIKNMMGLVLFTADETNNTPIEIDMEAFPMGIYAVYVESKSGASAKKIFRK